MFGPVIGLSTKGGAPFPNPGVCPSVDLGVFHFQPTKGVYLPPPAALLLLISKAAKFGR